MQTLSGLCRLPSLVPWPIEVLQLLEEHHLCAWAHEPVRRTRFADELARHLSRFDDTQVCLIQGSQVRDLASFCVQLEQAVDGDRVAPRIDGPHGVVETLRSRPHMQAEDRNIKRRYYLWKDADVLLRRDHRLFGRLVDAMVGVAAEGEFTSEDLLLLQRAVFVGAPSLDVYAEDPRGQFQTWWTERGEDPFWRTVTGVETPHLLRYRIGEEVGA